MTIISVEMMKWVRTVPRPANHLFIIKKTPENLELSDILLIFATSNIFWRKYINVEP